MNYKNPDGSNRKAREIRELKHDQADARQAEHDMQTTAELIKRLDERGFVAKRERAKLAKKDAV